MNNSIIDENFYINLNSVIKAQIEELYKAQRLYKFYSMVSIAFYLLIGAIFIYILKDILFTSNYFFNLNLLFNFCKIIIMISGSIFITSYINKIPSDNYKKTLTSLRELLHIDICTCNSKCNCKNLLIIYLKQHGINLLT